MAGDHVAQDEKGGGQPPSPFKSWFGQLTIALNAIGTVLIIVMSISINLDILGRELVNKPIPGVTEFLGLSIVAVVFLQMANTLREDRHVANDLIISALARKNATAAKALFAFFYLIGAFLMSLIAWFVIPTFLENYYGGFYKGTPGYVEIPVWPFMLVVLIGSTAAIAQYLLLSYQSLRSLFVVSST